MRIHIPSDCEKIHVLFSGGIDSTILLYLLLLEKQTRPDLEIKCYGLNSFNFGITYSRCKNILNKVLLSFLGLINIGEFYAPNLIGFYFLFH